MKSRLVWLLLCCIWGSTWLFIKIGLVDLPPLTFAGIRFVIAFITLALFIGIRRVPDFTPLYDAAATQDTVTLIRGAVRGLLRVCDDALEAEIRKYLRRDDDYVRAGKPTCD